MKFASRLQHLAKIRGLSAYQMAEIFGVSHQVMYSWLYGKTNPSKEFRFTLERFERESKPVLSPRISEKTQRVFYGASA